MYPNDADIIYHALETAGKNGYNWHGRWNESPRSDKILFSKNLAHDSSWRIYFFTKEFAIALWGDSENWERHLQKMVISDNQLDYLKTHLN